MSTNETVTMPEELRELLSEPGWEQTWEDISEDIGRQCCYSYAISDDLAVRYIWFQHNGQPPVWDSAPDALPTEGWALSLWELERAAAVMRRVEAALSGVAKDRR